MNEFGLGCTLQLALRWRGQYWILSYRKSLPGRRSESVEPSCVCVLGWLFVELVSHFSDFFHVHFWSPQMRLKKQWLRNKLLNSVDVDKVFCATRSHTRTCASLHSTNFRIRSFRTFLWFSLFRFQLAAVRRIFLWNAPLLRTTVLIIIIVSTV